MCSNCGGDYENPNATTEDLEFSDYGRECSGVARVGVWAAITCFLGAIWGFAIAWIYPALHQLISRIAQ